MWEKNIPENQALSNIIVQIVKFYKSKSSVAIISYANHTRVLVKQLLFKDTVIYLYDPWMQNGVDNHYIYRKIDQNLKELEIKLRFIPRKIRDQPKGEGSCSIAALARDLYISMSLMNEEKIVDNSNEEKFNNVNTIDILAEHPLNDSMALLSTSFIRNY